MMPHYYVFNFITDPYEKTTVRILFHHKTSNHVITSSCIAQFKVVETLALGVCRSNAFSVDIQ
jgi:hypothetical protein